MLAATIREKTWVGRDVPYEEPAQDLTPILVRILRGCPGFYITTTDLLTISLELARDVASTNSNTRQAAVKDINSLWRMRHDLRMGTIEHAGEPGMRLHKLALHHVSADTRAWLHKHRSRNTSSDSMLTLQHPLRLHTTPTNSHSSNVTLSTTHSMRQRSHRLRLCTTGRLQEPHVRRQCPLPPQTK